MQCGIFVVVRGADVWYNKRNGKRGSVARAGNASHEKSGGNMEERFDKQTRERAVLVGLNADCFAEEETATESTLDEL